MAETVENPFTLMGLEDELTCSICLSPFDCPVTIPCGHNFCQDCLLETWRDSNYSCPQCRSVFATKPELKKNTVLSTVVETLNLKSGKMIETIPVVEESKAKKCDVIRCDTCMQTEASKTCLTCMASYCEEHLQPHLENPVFRLHQLSEPVSDLLERICLDHHKLLEFFCSQHVRPICSICLQGVHKGCSFVSPEEQRNAKESDLRGKLGLLDGKITKNEDTLSETKGMQSKLTELATNRKKALAAEYQQMRNMLVRAEQDALDAVDCELEGGQTKLKDLMKKFTENIDSLSKAKEHIHSLLSQSQTLAFLQVSFDLPPATNHNPHTPRISLDSKKVVATEAFAAALKEYLTEIMKQPVEDQLLTLKPDEKNIPVTGSTGSPLESEPTQSRKQKRKPRSHSPGCPPIQPYFQPFGVPPGYIGAAGGWTPSHYVPGWAHGDRPMSASGFTPLNPGTNQRPGSQPKAGRKQTTQNNKKSTEDKMGNKDQPRGHASTAESKEKPETLKIPLDITSAEKRHELLKYATVLKFDPKTAHRRLVLSEDLTKASLSDEQIDYPAFSSRFTACTQVLAFKGYSRGRHYWEVRLSSNNFIGIGLCYSSMYRNGLISRLGRNPQSWCVEWFNNKLSAWYNSSETVLDDPNPKRVGVLLDCDEGTATFYNVADRAYPFHSFVFPFGEAVYPAFWIFSSGSSISLCTMQA